MSGKEQSRNGQTTPGAEALAAKLAGELSAMRSNGFYKEERVILSRQGAQVELSITGRERRALNLCSNNYLGLAGDQRVAAAAAAATDRWGAGTASVRFICGTLSIHKELELAIARYSGFEDAILFAAAFDANAAVFEPLFGEQDAIVSDTLNHASIIDGIRLSKAKRFRFANGDMEDLEDQLKSARSEGLRHVLIATDGVFSMDGYLAKLREVTQLAQRYDALVMVDDCHATGIIGPQGRGSFAECGVQVDIVTGTFGKALGGSMGGYVCASRPIVEYLRQRGRPYLFSNALAPAICGASLEAIRIAEGEEGNRLRDRLRTNLQLWRSSLEQLGFRILKGHHPITPVMLGDAALAQRMAADLLQEGLLVTGFSYPVVPQGAARIRTQVSAAHRPEDIEEAAAAFAAVGRRLGVIG